MTLTMVHRVFLSALLGNAVVLLASASPDAIFIPKTMRAVLLTGVVQKDGDFSMVKVVDNHPVPQVGHGQVLVKVAASSINPIDWKIFTPPLYPGPKVLGFDMAGTVVQMGPGCSGRLQAGDQVWADLGGGLGTGNLQLGAWADYAVADEAQLGRKPSSLDFESSAALPLVGLTSLQVLQKTGFPWADRSNLTVVVVSGAGGTGVTGIQLAKASSKVSRIISSSSPKNADLLRRLGATDVIDYHKSTIWDTLPQDSVDIVFDNYGAPGTADAAMPALRSGGAYIFLPGKGGAVSKHPKTGVSQFNFGTVDPTHHEDLDVLARFATQGQLVPVIENAFALEDIFAAMKMSVEGHVVGKVSIDMAATSDQEPVVV